MAELTQEILKSLIKYIPETGEFFWRVRKGGMMPNSRCGAIKGSGYLYIHIDGKSYVASRLAHLYMVGTFPDSNDHINHIKDDDRWENLRNVPFKDNLKNKSLDKRNKSGTTGVYWRNSTKKWLVSICINRKLKHIGCYDNLSKAICVRKTAEKKYGFHKNHGLPMPCQT